VRNIDIKLLPPSIVIPVYHILLINVFHMCMTLKQNSFTVVFVSKQTRECVNRMGQMFSPCISFFSRERDERKLQQRTNPKGSVTVHINATDLFSRYKDDLAYDDR
jgi:hypothetical protein